MNQYSKMTFQEYLSTAVMSSSVFAGERYIDNAIQKLFSTWYYIIYPGDVSTAYIRYETSKIDKKDIRAYLKSKGFSKMTHLIYLLGGASDGPSMLVAMSPALTSLNLIGDGEVVEEFKEFFKPYQAPEEKMLTTVLDFGDNGSSICSYTPLAKMTQKPILTSSYPTLEHSVEEIAEGFKASTCRLLLLIGPPGTGKTSFLRELIQRLHMCAMACNDTDVIRGRQLYINFLNSDVQDLLVLEDADIVVESRETGNTIMPLLLNILDGLATNEKRLIISTNLPSLKKIDEALIRPGRCYDVLEFGKMTREQANAARAGFNLPAVDLSGQEKWTLSEAINFESVQSIERHKRGSIGF